MSIFLCIFAGYVHWPAGSYGIPRAASGCPSDYGFDWLVGQRKQDTEDTDPQNSQSPEFHLNATVYKSAVLRSFCLKTDTSADENRTSWPRGKAIQPFCIWTSLFLFFLSGLFQCRTYHLRDRAQSCWILIGWDRGHIFFIFFGTRAKLLIPDWPSAKITRIWLAERESAPFAFCRCLETKNGFKVVQHRDRFKFWLLTGFFVKVVWKSGVCVKRCSKRWTYMCYGRQKMVICSKTTETFGATWSKIFPARGSFATQVNKIYLLNWVLRMFCQWSRIVFISVLLVLLLFSFSGL